ncbi:hypothetical protein F4780DRAFT_466079 [Xylariomycetidae sp. FL0641]|nr:hypothetical protein F4780DRAFT_466079 [Xylariomycetidae sp. FL0641]
MARDVALHPVEPHGSPLGGLHILLFLSYSLLSLSLIRSGCQGPACVPAGLLFSASSIAFGHLLCWSRLLTRSRYSTWKSGEEQGWFTGWIRPLLLLLLSPLSSSYIPTYMPALHTCKSHFHPLT